MTYILPKFTPLFKSQGTKLPAATLIMMAPLRRADALVVPVARRRRGWPVAGFLYGRRTPAGPRSHRLAQDQLPIVGPMLRKVVISRSIRTLGTMLASGVPIMEAIQLAGQVSGNCYYEGLWEQRARRGDRRQADLRGPRGRARCFPACSCR